MLLNPQSVRATAKDCSIRVNPNTVHHLREAYGGATARDAAYRFVPAEFQAAADDIYLDLGMPDIGLDNAWEIFRIITQKLHISDFE